MNERIKLLAEQATKHYPATETSGEFEIFDKEKFAELIVGECSQYVLDTVKYTTPSKESPMLATALAKRIKQHFGVEE